MVSHISAVRILLFTLSILLCMQWLGAFAIEVTSKSGRKLLLNGVQTDAIFPSSHSHDAGSSSHFSFSPKNKIAAVAVPGMLIVGCLFICPCVKSKKKESPSAVYQKEFPSMDSSSSFEAHPNLEKVPVSPWRHAPPSPSPSRFPPQSPSHSRHPPPSPSRYAMSPKLDRFGSVNLNFSQISKATHNFSSSFKIGEGGFGTVYKAQLPAGHWIAVKRAKKMTFPREFQIRTLWSQKVKHVFFDPLGHLYQLSFHIYSGGYYLWPSTDVKLSIELEQFDSDEFNREIEILSKIEHRNLVRLLGYVDKGNERLVVTEYVSNGTLREHLDGLRDRVLDFNQRLEIAIDVAHGLTYLHLYAEKQIIHRDVKSSNILLTENFRAKVADFGFARVGPVDTEKTHISTKVKGTVGYLDPEYMKTYQLTPKSDVYSFGILLLEILTGRRPVEPKRVIEERVTLRWAFYRYNEGDVLRLVDPLLNESIDVEILKKMFCLAFQCAAPVRADRRDMKIVGEQLWAIRMEYKSSTKKGRSF